MSSRRKVVHEETRNAAMLPSILASLGLAEKPDLSDYEDDRIYRIHWALRVLKYSGFEAVACYGFRRYFEGPFSSTLEQDLKAMHWREVATAPPIDDIRVTSVREAVQKGDDFLLALSIIVGVVDLNKGISRDETLWMVDQIRPECKHVADEAYAFAEERIWPK